MMNEVIGVRCWCFINSRAYLYYVFIQCAIYFAVFEFEFFQTRQLLAKSLASLPLQSAPMASNDSRNGDDGRGSDGALAPMLPEARDASTLPLTESDTPEKQRQRLSVLYPNSGRKYDLFRNKTCLEMAIAKGEVALGIKWLLSFHGKRAELMRIVTEKADETYVFAKTPKRARAEVDQEAPKKHRNQNTHTKKHFRSQMATVLITIGTLESEIKILVSFFFMFLPVSLFETFVLTFVLTFIRNSRKRRATSP